MPFVSAPNIVELQFRFTFDVSETMNRIHINTGGTPTPADLLAINIAAESWYEDNVEDIVPPSLVLREVYSKSLETQPGPEATFTAGLPLAGALGQPALPNNVSLAVSLRSGETGRSARGRWFWQGLTEGQVTDNNVNVGTAADITSALTNLKDVIDGLGFSWVIVSYTADGAPRPGGPVYFTVNTITLVNTVIDSQRRRLPGRGR